MRGAIVGAWLAAGLALAPVATSAKANSTDATALDRATAELCTREVAVLGEAEHGDARTEMFKIALIERLVSRCGFSAVLFEASFYEFVALDRAMREGSPITPGQLAIATGGLWRYDREFQPLLEYLAGHGSNGTIRLGGVDFQQGGADQDFGNFGVVAELTATLPAAHRETCRSAFKDLLFSGSKPELREATARCSAHMAALPPATDSETRRDQAEMLANLAAFAASDPADPGSFIAARDRAMFANFERWMARWPKRTKVIVWTANSHAARAPHTHKGFAGVEPFGSYLARKYGRALFSLGFTAKGGTTRGRPTPRVIEPPVPDSLELTYGPVLPDGAMFLDRQSLANVGTRLGSLFSHLPTLENWSRLFDGVIVFETESAATDIRTAATPD